MTIFEVLAVAPVAVQTLPNGDEVEVFEESLPLRYTPASCYAVHLWRDSIPEAVNPIEQAYKTPYTLTAALLSRPYYRGCAPDAWRPRQERRIEALVRLLRWESLPLWKRWTTPKPEPWKESAPAPKHPQG